MESLLERGEKLDDLVAKSEHLGNQSKAFYKTVSKKQNCQHWAVRSLIALPRLHVQPTGTKTELLLRSHVMPLPRPHGHASLCLFALPTTPIMPPVVESVDKKLSLKVGGIHCKKGLRVTLKSDLCRLQLIWWGGRLKMLWGCSGVEVIFV